MSKIHVDINDATGGKVGEGEITEPLIPEENNPDDQ